MFVSILQLMGLAIGKPIQSRPGSDPKSGLKNEPSKVDNKGIKRQDKNCVSPEQSQPARASSKDPLASTSRRQELKSQTAKPTAQAKVQAPTDSPRKAPSSTAKASVKKAEPAVEVASQSVAKGSTPMPVKPAAKAAKAPKASKLEASATAPATQALAARSPENGVRTVPQVPASTPKAGAPAKAGRPSRLSQITVPSMAQAVASTAAKASYTNTMSSPVLTHPPFTPVKKDPKLANNWKTKTADQLTDAEVLAMSDDEYMNDKQMAFFRLKLSQLKQDILSNAGETTEHLREDTAVVPDPADRATIEEEHALELRTRDRERKLLKKIEQSIIRIDAGDYGYCDETGEPIGVGRLLARPTATLSLEAQQRRELKQKMFGD